MKDFIKFCYAGCVEATDDVIIFVLMLLLNVALWIGTGYLLVVLTDQVFQETHKEVLSVTNKVFTEEYTTMIMSGKVVVPVTYPDEWVVYFGGIVNCQVGEEFYNQVLVGKGYEVTYDKGVSGMTYCDRVEG